MKSSTFWTLRNFSRRLQYFKSRLVAELIPEALRIIHEDGMRIFLLTTKNYFIPRLDNFESISYEKWIAHNEKKYISGIKEEIEKFEYKPKISIIISVYNGDPHWLDKCIESVKNQFYANWELCIQADGSKKATTVECLKKWELIGDLRIKISFGKDFENISKALNDALKIATGDFIALLDHDDELAPDALYENLKLLNQHPEADFIYSDEDKIDHEGKRSKPFFKPDWSPHLCLSQMYTCHLGVYRKNIVDEIGGFRIGYEGSQDYDLVLRFTEKIDRNKIFHIPKVLYHMRTVSITATGNTIFKNHSIVAAKKALTDYLKRNNIAGKVLDGQIPGTYRIKKNIIGNPMVSIIIPFKDQVNILKTCLISIIKKTAYKNYEIILINNQSQKRHTFDYLKSIQYISVFKVIEYNKAFNYSAINNFAVQYAKGEYILFLNNDTEVISEEWLSALLEQAQAKNVGAVGAKLLYPNDTFQHAGVVMGIGIADHAFKKLPSYHPGYFGFPHVIRNYCAVTAACMMIRKKLFEEIGGFDEINLSVGFNDVDLCLRLIENGYYNIYTPYAELYHYESLSRGNDDEKDLKSKDPEKFNRVNRENNYMKKKWAKYIARDPFYSPNLTKTGEDFSIRIGQDSYYGFSLIVY